MQCFFCWDIGKGRVDAGLVRRGLTALRVKNQGRAPWGILPVADGLPLRRLSGWGCGAPLLGSQRGLHWANQGLGMCKVSRVQLDDGAAFVLRDGDVVWICNCIILDVGELSTILLVASAAGMLVKFVAHSPKPLACCRQALDRPDSRGLVDIAVMSCPSFLVQEESGLATGFQAFDHAHAKREIVCVVSHQLWPRDQFRYFFHFPTHRFLC